MRVINTDTFKFEELDPLYDTYAIVSHRWTSDEVTYQDYLAGNKRDAARYAKIFKFCQLAKQEGLKWAWIDTCCINKESSAELSEAINSMYRWYAAAIVCFVYLVDVPAISQAGHHERSEAFNNSQWWKRGWTLQELLAPSNLVYYDSAWHRLGTREDLVDLIATKTGIGKTDICGFSPYSHFSWETSSPSVATIMSWLSHRRTQKPEDMAYCTMGLFGVNMPLLYGEGPVKAYVRLQLEILKKSEDHSIFTWSGIKVYGLVALWPALFASANKVRRIKLDNPLFELKPFSMTNRGLKLRMPTAEASDGNRLILLNCCTGGCENCSNSEKSQDTSDSSAYRHQWLAVKLRQISNNLWIRADLDLYQVDPRAFTLDKEPIYVLQDYI